MTTNPRKKCAVAVSSMLACLASIHVQADVPPVTAKTTRAVYRFQDVAVSPDGAFVASLEGGAGGLFHSSDLVIRRVRTGVATTVALPCARAVECSPGSPAWTPDGKHLTFTLRTPGGHGRSIYTVGADGTGLVKLMEFGGTIINLSYGPDGRLAMLATENARKEVGPNEPGVAFVGDLDEPPQEQRIAILEAGVLHWASPPDLFVHEYDWWPAGNGFVGIASPGYGDNTWYSAKLHAFSAADGSGRVIYTPSDIRQQIAAPKVSRDGKTVAFVAGTMSDFGLTGGDVYTLRLTDASATTTATSITPGMHASARAIAWSCQGSLLANLLASDKTEIVDLGDGSGSSAPRVLWSGVESLDRNHGGLTIGCPSGITVAVHQSFTTAPEIEVGTIGHWRDLTRVNAGMTAPGRAQSLTWSSDGFQVQGWLLLPARIEGKAPLIVEVHGGPAHAWVPVFEGPGLEATLLERGYALFRPNPRGSFGQGERFTAANVRDLGYGDLRDIQSGIDTVLQAAPIDGNRAGIMGHSYGGFMTMWAVTQTNRFKAAVVSSGWSNWVSYYGECDSTQWIVPYFGKSVYEDPEIYQRSSPINFIRNAHTPTILHAGELDFGVPSVQMQEFWHALKELGVPTSFVIYRGEGHGLRDPGNVADSDRRILEWFGKYLKND